MMHINLPKNHQLQAGSDAAAHLSAQDDALVSLLAEAGITVHMRSHEGPCHAW